MKFITLLGATRSVKKPSKYIIDWDGKSRSKIQRSVKLFLKPFWSHKVVFEEFPMAGSRLSFDLFNASDRIAIEVQGQQHTKYTPFFHGKNKINYIDQLRRDKLKMDFCKKNKINLIEIYFNDIVDKSFFRKQGIELV